MRSEETCHNFMTKDQFSEPYFHVYAAVAAVKSIWGKQATEKSTQIDTFFDKNIPKFIPLDPLVVQHCLNNLASNAVKYTQNGHIKIIVSLFEAPNNSKSPQCYLALSIQDTGVGIEPSKLDTLFQTRPIRGQQLEQAFGVVDSSMAMTHDLVSNFGGKLLVKSEIGKGSVFSLLLPIKQKLPVTDIPCATRTETAIHQYSELNILVVDDYNLNQLTVKTLLHDHMGKIYSATNGYEALEILQSCAVDIVFMDINMPILDGITTTLKIRESTQDWSGVRIIAMTADPQYHHAHLYQKIGMDGALAKPFRKRELLHILENCAVPYKNAACE